MGRRVDLEAGGGRFDSWRAKVTVLGHAGNSFLLFLHMFGQVWGHFWGRVRDTFGSGSDHFGVELVSLFDEIWEVLGCVWEWSGDVFGWVWEGFGKMSDGVRKSKFSKLTGSMFHESGRFRIAVLTDPGQKILNF